MRFEPIPPNIKKDLDELKRRALEEILSSEENLDIIITEKAMDVNIKGRRPKWLK